ncbi:hypothetical protein Syun_018391 [Stephania yunnanensis]|uniref:Neprosin PEP catalytic domain-containing protein n=1 Tax=Stephania yunnanensis TaxID=152371 RepID=A0AAP0NW97_9MAGN
MDESPSTNIFRKATLQCIDCPEGTVPIKRVGKEELRASKRFFESIPSRSNEVSPQASKYPGVYQAVAKLNGGYKGIRSKISAQKLENVAANHWSTGQMWVSDDPDGGYINSLWAGWIVAPTMFQDKGETRLFAHWGTDINKQCFNTYCGGFVATSKKTALGGILTNVSIYGGDQYVIDTYIFQDKGTGNWWLQVEEENVGYWPKGLIPALDDGASTVMWGGLTFGPAGENASPMGNGRFPLAADFQKSCYSAHMRTVDSAYNLVEAPKHQDFNIDCEAAHHVSHFWGASDLGVAILYGGPGGACS